MEATQASWSTPDARLVLSASAPRADWLAARTLGLGGTDVAVLHGDNPYSNRFALWLDKTGQADVWEGSDAAQRGTWLEPHLATWFTETTDLKARRIGLLQSKTHQHRLANVDRCTADGGILEIKTHDRMATVAKEWADDGISATAYTQAQWYLGVTGRSHIWYVVMIGDTPSLRGPVDRDTDLINTLETLADSFWNDHVLTGIAPPVDLDHVTDAELALRWPTTDPDVCTDITGVDAFTLEVDWADYLTADVEAKRWKAVADAAKTRIKAQAAGKEFLSLDGRPVARLQTITSNRLDTSALKKDMPDVAEKFTKSTTTVRVTIKEQS